MKRKLLLSLVVALFSAVGAWAQNIISAWDGGENTGSPSEFGWSSSENRTLSERNGSGIRMTTTYSGYKLEDETAYSYSASSELSSVIFWVRYNTGGESFTYTFKGLEPDSYYDFSALIGWHNNSDAPTLTVVINDGTNTYASMSKAVSKRQTLYKITSRFRTPGIISNTTDINIVFTCNKTGDCMEAISALQLVKVNEVLKTDLKSAIDYATTAKVYVSTDLSSAITNAQNVYDNASATQEEVNNAEATLYAAVKTAINAEPLKLVNPGFESTEAATTNYAAIGDSGNSVDYFGTGWKRISQATWSSSAVVEYGGEGQVNGVSAPATDNADNTGKTLGISVGWGGKITYQTVSPITLPEGYYTLTVYGNNQNADATQFKSLNGFVTTGGTEYLSKKTSFTYNTWEADEFGFTLNEATEGYIQIGGQAVSEGSGKNAKVFFDNIILVYKSFLDGAKEEWDKAKSAAEAAKTENAVVVGEELTALNAELSKTEPATVEDYNKATEALEKATATLVAAAPSYNALVAARTDAAAYTAEKWPYASAAKYTELTTAAAVAAPTSAEDAKKKAEAIVTAYRQFVESNGKAEGVDVAVSFDSYIAGADPETNTGWTNGIGVDNRDWEKYTDGSGVASGKYYDGGWSTSAGVDITMTRTLTLPEGEYLLQVTARGSEKLTNYQMSIGEQSVDLPKDGSGEAVGTFGHGWSDCYIVFKSTGAELTLTIAATSTEFQQWISFNRFRLVKLDATLANDADYAALNKAISDAEAKTLGFEKDEYAPYNNVDAIKKLAEAKALDQKANNIQGDVQALTAELNGLTWTPNDSEVEETIFNGDFAIVEDGQNYPKGWKRTNSWGNMQGEIEGDYATAYYNQPGSLQYGLSTGYTLPLKADTYYEVSFAYRSHENNSNTGMTVTLQKGESEMAKASFEANGSTSEWAEKSALLKTGEAGDYALTLANGGNTWMTAVSMVKAKAGDVRTYLTALLKAEIDNAKALNTTKNVGEGVFQIPTAAVTAINNAVSDANSVCENAEATFTELEEAIDALKAAIQVYKNVALNAPAADKRYYLNIVDDQVWDGYAITFIAGGREGEGDYTVKYLAKANSNLCQALKLTAVDGSADTYYISAVRSDGKEQYLTTKLLAYGSGSHTQLRTTDDVAKALAVKVRLSETDGQFQLLNVSADYKVIARNATNPDNGVYTDGNANFTIAEAAEASVNLTIDSDVKYATAIFPFVPELPSGVKAYSCEAKDGNTLTLAEVAEPVANVPYILYAEAGCASTDLKGWGLGTAETCTTGWLTGVYTDQPAPVGNYVLLNKNEKVAFYIVAEGKQPTVTANHAYLTIPAENSEEIKAFFLGGDANGIEILRNGENETMSNAAIYNMAGQRVSKAQKGIYIVNGKKNIIK